ncbi:MAG: hypothetical protein CMM50_03565 [Rhodospirillaceae bacterium]|nr:hypothetical protein [Rhodospirillaceae bacterium]
MSDLGRVGDLLEQVRVLAAAYYEETGKPLGVTGEMGEYLAAKHLDLELAGAREPGYDAIGANGRRIQIKARVLPSGKRLTGQRLGAVTLDHACDSVLLVLMNERFEPVAMHEADSPAVEAALLSPGSKARNVRGALSIRKFMSIGRQVWPRRE